jgi:glycosidase/fibronectin type 3 domain-containing protein
MRRLGMLLFAVLLLAGGAALPNTSATPASVNLAGDLESEATGGACGDWDPSCAASRFTAQPNDVWDFTSQSIPAGDWQYKVGLGSWDENYGLNGERDGPNIPLHLSTAGSVRFVYDDKTHYIGDDVNHNLWTVPGSYGPAIGCGAWAPDCFGSFMSDNDADGIFTFSTSAIEPGSYEFKVAANGSWNENYGAGGVPGGPNIAFSVTVPGSTVTFSFNTATHTPGVSVQPPQSSHDNNVEWDGLRHDSRSDVYRTPGGAVPAGIPVKLRFRTFHNDVTSVKVRAYDVNASSQTIVRMTPAATDVSCYQQSLDGRTCDFWQATVSRAKPDNLWYRFIVTDGTKTVYYADDTAALDGGLGAPSDNVVDQSYALMFYDPGFTTPAWMRSAVLYQIFPDRFRNGNTKNDPNTGDVRYDDPVLKLPWNTKPEGYCRSYADASTNCPWRFDASPPSWSPTIEGPRGRDYMGGDLRGVDDKLAYLQSLGVTAIYFNPVFASKSNHGYDTSDYRQINPYLGTLKDFKDLVAAANARGIKVILDGVFNHMSSDSPFFDRYHHYDETGACESLASPWRTWFTFTTSNVPCGSSDYVGWFGFDSIPVLQKSNPDVQKYFVDRNGSVARMWLDRGASGWRLDVMGDSSFPDGYWETFRRTVKSTDANAVIVGELWPKDTTTLRFLRGDRADSTMNYRLRDAVLGLLAPQAFDGKGLGDSGRPLSVSEAASRLRSIWEDYPPAAGYELMNLLDSHDTARLLWQLTPGPPTTAAKEQDAAALSEGKARMRLAALVQFGVPGAPTVYYGDEVGMTGADDPDDRRTYPWADTGGSPDTSLLDFYRGLGALKHSVPALDEGDFRVLLADDAAGTLAFGRRTTDNAAVVAINRSDASRTLDIPVAGYVPDGTSFDYRYGGSGSVTVSGGVVHVALGPREGALLATGTVDLRPPAAPSGLSVSGEDAGSVALQWHAVEGAALYAIYRSPLSGGGYVRDGETDGTTFTDTGLHNSRTYHYVVRALDALGNESADSSEVVGVPHAPIGYAVVQWPKSITWTISVEGTDDVYGQVYAAGETDAGQPPEDILAQAGFGPRGSTPGPSWTWYDARFNVKAGNNYEYVTKLYPETPGSYDYAYRFSTDGGRSWTYGDADGVYPGNGYDDPAPLTVDPSSDATPPATPANFHRVSSSPSAIEVAWDAVTGDPSLYGYEVLRDGVQIARVTGTDFVDADVDEGQTYSYAVRSVDTSVNRSPATAPISITAEQRLVDVTFEVTVPPSTDATGRTVHIAGTLSRLQGGLPDWDPGAVALTREDATHWHVTLHGYEGTQLEYKYTLGDWDHVEKGSACDEIANRTLTLTYGANGAQTVNDTVANWRNVSPCGA